MVYFPPDKEALIRLDNLCRALNRPPVPLVYLEDLEDLEEENDLEEEEEE